MKTLKSPMLTIASGALIAGAICYLFFLGLRQLILHPRKFLGRVWRDDRSLVLWLIVAVIINLVTGCATTETITIPAPPAIQLERAP